MIVWDEKKRLENIAKHGLDFAELDDAFFEDALVRTAHSGRLKAIGRLHDLFIVAVIFTPLGTEAISVISLRAASKKEKEDYAS